MEQGKREREKVRKEDGERERERKEGRKGWRDGGRNRSVLLHTEKINVGTCRGATGYFILITSAVQ